MSRQARFSEMKWFWMSLFILVMTNTTVAQDVEARLAQKPDFTPTANTVREQLVEVAQHYKIPMGIEWVVQPRPEPAPAVSVEEPTVRAQLNSILQSTPNYSLVVKDGIVSVSTKRYAADSNNFLNLNVGEFNMSKANVFDAEAELRSRIHTTLHPERYLGGSNGGYGYGVPREDGLDLTNVSFSGKDLTVRDILDRIVKSNGNTLWLVNLVPSRIMRHEPFFSQFDSEEETDFFWKIISFSP